TGLFVVASTDSNLSLTQRGNKQNGTGCTELGIPEWRSISLKGIPKSCARLIGGDRLTSHERQKSYSQRSAGASACLELMEGDPWARAMYRVDRSAAHLPLVQ